MDDIDRCIDLDPSFGDAYMMRSILHREMGHNEEAQSDSVMARRLGVPEW